MSNLNLSLSNISDQPSRDNFQKIQDLLNKVTNAGNKFDLITISATANAVDATMQHSLNVAPTDAIITSLIAPSAAKLTLDYASFDKEFVYYSVSGLNSGEKLTATVLVGNAKDLLTLLTKGLVASSGVLA
jgi:hypothetical protein